MKHPIRTIYAAAIALVVSLPLPARSEKSGTERLEELLVSSAEQIRELRENRARLDDPRLAELRARIDNTAHQRDAYASGLYWHTDMEAAKAEAARSGRPILSLRLLGNLDEEYSCANSRFFRTVLYANAEVSKVLRENYVLHWKSVRPAPLLTIDMGDGRRIKRTITGNSIHYVLNAQGRVLDALPGIYSPSAFLAALNRVNEHACDHSPGEIRDWHGREAHQLCIEWLNAAVRAGVYGEEARQKTGSNNPDAPMHTQLARTAFPGWKAAQDGKLNIPESQSVLRFTAAQREKRALTRTEDILGDIPVLRRLMKLDRPGLEHTWTEVFDPPGEFDPGKAMVERPIMKKALPGPANAALDPASPATPGPSLAGRMTAEWWAKIAEPFQHVARLDEASRRMMIQKLPVDAVRATEVKAGAPESMETPFGRLLSRFESAIAQDMVRNEYFYHTQIHQWLEEDRDGLLATDVEALNRRVYDELFLTPDYDAWLGLVPEDTYTALEKDGCACDPGAPAMRQVTRR